MKTINLIKRRAISLIEIKKYKRIFLLLIISLNLILLVFLARSFVLSSRLENTIQEYRNLESTLTEIKKNIKEQDLLFFKNFFSKSSLFSGIIKEKKYFSFILYKIAEFLPENFYIDSIEILQKDLNLSIYAFPTKEGREVELLNDFIAKLENTEVFLRGRTEINSQGNVEWEGKSLLFFKVSFKLS